MHPMSPFQDIYKAGGGMRCDTCIRRRVMRDGSGFTPICIVGMDMSNSTVCQWYMDDDDPDWREE